MPTDHARELANSDRVYLMAPAGHGKTHTIAEAVCQGKTGRQLVLTHTHAGVHALKKKLREQHAPANSFHVDTMDGWALRYAKAYPKLSGLIDQIARYDGDWMPQVTEEWRIARRSATQALLTRIIREVVQATYAGVYVDEYQDCDKAQQDLVMSLAGLLPCRIVCDPLQAIFDFRGDSPPNVEDLSARGFRQIEDLPTPWRWDKQNGGNPALGEWLNSTVRTSLQADGEVDLGELPQSGVVFRMLPHGKESIEEKRKAIHNECWRLHAREGESVVVILKLRDECYSLTKKLGGCFQSIEEIYSSSLIKWSADIENSRGNDRIGRVLSFAGECWTKSPKDMKEVAMLAKGEKQSFVRQDEHSSLISALRAVAAVDDMSAILEVTKLLSSKTKWHRWELWQEMRRAIEAVQSGRADSLTKAAWSVRHRTSRIGRWLPSRVVSTPLLIKGLEFDHAMVLDPETLDREELYVALTRGSKSLTILSSSKVVHAKIAKTAKATHGQQTLFDVE